MAHDEGSTLVEALKDALADLRQLVQAELRLAKAELGAALAGGVKAGIWMAVAGLIGLMAVLFLLQAIVFGLASLGLGVGWASLIVAVILLAVAAGAFFYGRAQVKPLTPTRTIRQVNRDVAALREQLT
jgi:hypothetical protein